jgi:hypothetical protein
LSDISFLLFIFFFADLPGGIPPVQNLSGRFTGPVAPHHAPPAVAHHDEAQDHHGEGNDPPPMKAVPNGSIGKHGLLPFLHNGGLTDEHATFIDLESAFFFQDRFKLLTRPVQAHFYILHGDPEDVGDLLQAAFHDVGQNQDRSVRIREKVKLVLNALGHFTLLHFLLDGSFFKVHQPFMDFLPGRFFVGPEVILNLVMGNAKDPG